MMVFHKTKTISIPNNERMKQRGHWDTSAKGKKQDEDIHEDWRPPEGDGGEN